MKVTQIIRNAIENAVNAKAQEKIDQLTKEQVAPYEVIEGLQHDLDTLIKRTVITWVKDVLANNYKLVLCDNRYTNFGVKLPIDTLIARLTSDYTCKTQEFGFHFSTEELKKNKQEIEDIKFQAKNTVDSIILDLELGSKNKSEVQNLLDKVKF